MKHYKKIWVLLLLLTGVFVAPQHSLAAPSLPAEDGVFTVTVEEAEEALARALEAEGAADMVSAKITNTRPGVLFRHKHALGVEVKTLKFEERDGHFSANVYFISNDEVMSVAAVSGRYEEMIALPVARHRLHRGDEIVADDLDEIAYPISRLRKDTIVSAKQIIGKTPLRIVSKGRPIRLSELKTPNVLSKGARVQMRFLTPFMIISTTGEAMEDGAEGDSIKVRNFESGTIVEARIHSESEVVVGNAPFRVE